MLAGRASARLSSAGRFAYRAAQPRKLIPERRLAVSAAAGRAARASGNSRARSTPFLCAPWNPINHPGVSERGQCANTDWDAFAAAAAAAAAEAARLELLRASDSSNAQASARSGGQSRPPTINGAGATGAKRAQRVAGGGLKPKLSRDGQITQLGADFSRRRGSGETRSALEVRYGWLFSSTSRARRRKLAAGSSRRQCRRREPHIRSGSMRPRGSFRRSPARPTLRPLPLCLLSWRERLLLSERRRRCCATGALNRCGRASLATAVSALAHCY